MATRFFGGDNLSQIATITAQAIVVALASIGILTLTNSSQFSVVNQTQKFYVATTGTDANNDCRTQASPCATINGTLQKIAAGTYSGNPEVVLSDGTYNENVVAYDLLSASSTPSTGVTGFPYVASKVIITGNVTTPDNVVIQGASGKLGVFSNETDTTYFLRGMKLSGTGAATESALYTSGPNSNTIIAAINTTNTGRIATINFGSSVFLDNNHTAGGNFIYTTFGWTVGREGKFYFNRGFNTTSTTAGANSVFSLSDGASALGITTGQRFNFYSPDCASGAGFIQDSGMESRFKAFGNTDVVNAICGTGGTSLFRPINGARAQIVGSATLNVSSTNSFPLADVDSISYLYSIGTPTWNILGSTVRALRVYQGGMALDPTNFGGATVTYTDANANYDHGYDGRYVKQSAPIFGKTITPSATTGSQTINNPTGCVNLAAGVSNITVTSTQINPNSVIFSSLGSNDTTMKALSWSATTGSVTFFADNAPALNAKICFLVGN